MPKSYRNETLNKTLSALQVTGDQKRKKETRFEINNNFYTGRWGNVKNPVTFISTSSTSYQRQLIYSNMFKQSEGFGVAFFANNDFYKGAFKNGKPHGKGRYIWADGAFYDGEWLDGKPYGQGRYVSDDTCYDGEWRKGKRHGRGNFNSKNGHSYEGEWKEDNPDGQGKRYFRNGAVYKGQLKNGEPDGQGIYLYADGTLCDGEWRNGKQHGQGKTNGYSKGTFKNVTAVDVSNIRIKDSNYEIHTTTDKNELDELYFYHSIESRKILQSFLLQFGNIQSNQECAKKMKDLEELRKFIKDSKSASLHNEEKFYVIETPENPGSLIMLFAKGKACYFDNDNELAKEFSAVIKKNEVGCVRLPHEFNVICKKLKESLSDQKNATWTDYIPSISSCCYGNSDTINDELTFQKGPNTPLTDGQSATGTPDSNVHGATSSQLDIFHISL